MERLIRDAPGAPQKYPGGTHSRIIFPKEDKEGAEKDKEGAEKDKEGAEKDKEGVEKDKGGVDEAEYRIRSYGEIIDDLARQGRIPPEPPLPGEDANNDPEPHSLDKNMVNDSSTNDSSTKVSKSQDKPVAKKSKKPFVSKASEFTPTYTRFTANFSVSSDDDDDDDDDDVPEPEPQDKPVAKKSKKPFVSKASEFTSTYTRFTANFSVSSDDDDDDDDVPEPQPRDKRARKVSFSDEVTQVASGESAMAVDVDESGIHGPLQRGKKRDRAEAGSTLGGEDDDIELNTERSVPLRRTRKRRTSSKHESDTGPAATRGQKRGRDPNDSEIDTEDEKLHSRRKKRGKKNYIILRDHGKRTFGEEWVDSDIRWKVDHKGQLLRLDIVKQMAPKYRMVSLYTCFPANA